VTRLTALRGQAATLERLRADRQLQEALARGPDPWHNVRRPRVLVGNG